MPPPVRPPVNPPVTPSVRPCPAGMIGVEPFCRNAPAKPDILATGICATSPQLPCCNQTIEVYRLLSGPFEIADLSYPDCRPDGYYQAKQCHWAGCYCVDPNGNSVDVASRPPGPGSYNIQCPGAGEMNERAKECNDGETKMADCNTCRCASGRWACTKKLCYGARPMDGTNTMNTMNTMNTNVATGSFAASGEACLSACNAAHSPWKAIGEKDPKKEAAWKCVDKCADVTCARKCEIVFPNRGEEITVMNCKRNRCKSNAGKTTPSPRGGDNNRYAVKGGLRKFVTKKQNYGVKS